MHANGRVCKLQTSDSRCRKMAGVESLVDFKIYLDQGKYREAEKFLKEQENQEVLKEHGWELAGIICTFLTSEDSQVLECCSSCLGILVEVCKPKEILLVLNEHFRYVKSIRGFSIIAQCCYKVFNKIERKQSLYLKDILDGFAQAVKNLIDIEDDATSETNLANFKSTVEVVLIFTDNLDHLKYPHFKDLKIYYNCFGRRTKWNDYEIKQCQWLVVFFFFDVLELLNPYIDQIMEGSDSINDLSTAINENMYRFIDFSQLLDTNEVLVINHVGFLIFIHTELRRRSKHFPMVFSPKKIYFNIQPFVTSQLKRTASITVKLALEVHSAILGLLPKESLLEKDVDSGLQVAIVLSKIMVWCDDKPLREKSKNQFDQLLQKYPLRERYQVLRLLYCEIENPSLCGYVIGLIGNTIKDDGSEGISSSDIKELALLFTSFKQGENILQEPERLMAGLNFLRYWLLKDNKSDNKTGIWDALPELLNNCKHVRCGIEVSTGEYQKFLNSPEKTTGMELELTIPGSEVMRNMSRDDRIMFAESAILSLEMMLSVIVRLAEITDT